MKSAQRMQAEPPRILQVYRDFLQPGADAEYREIEEDAARACARLDGPNPYLAIESLSGPREVWYLNGYRSAAHEAAVAEGYRTNAPLMAALEDIATRKAHLVGPAMDVRTRYREDLSRGVPWRPGDGRFLVITLVTGSQSAEGTVFEADDGTHFIVAPARSREEADAKARASAAGAETRTFAVRPGMSMPAQEWIDADPAFWQAGSL